MMSHYLFFLGGGVVWRGGGEEEVFILLLSSFSESQQNENKLSSLLLINMQAGADAFSAILIFKSLFIYTSARPPFSFSSSACHRAPCV